MKATDAKSAGKAYQKSMFFFFFSFDCSWLTVSQRLILSMTGFKEGAGANCILPPSYGCRALIPHFDRSVLLGFQRGYADY